MARTRRPILDAGERGDVVVEVGAEQRDLVLAVFRGGLSSVPSAAASIFLARARQRRAATLRARSAFSRRARRSRYVVATLPAITPSSPAAALIAATEIVAVVEATIIVDDALDYPRRRIFKLLRHGGVLHLTIRHGG